METNVDALQATPIEKSLENDIEMLYPESSNPIPTTAASTNLESLPAKNGEKVDDMEDVVMEPDSAELGSSTIPDSSAAIESRSQEKSASPAAPTSTSTKNAEESLFCSENPPPSPSVISISDGGGDDDDDDDDEAEDFVTYDLSLWKAIPNRFKCLLPKELLEVHGDMGRALIGAIYSMSANLRQKLFTEVTACNNLPENFWNTVMIRSSTETSVQIAAIALFKCAISGTFDHIRPEVFQKKKGSITGALMQCHRNLPPFYRALYDIQAGFPQTADDLIAGSDESGVEDQTEADMPNQASKKKQRFISKEVTAAYEERMRREQARWDAKVELAKKSKLQAEAIPNEKSRLIINMSKSEDEPFIYIPDSVANATSEIFDSQIEDIAIADEAHALNNTGTNIRRACDEIKTMAKVALTGSPMANNTLEYYHMVNWVAPKYMGSEEDFKISYARPIEDANVADATPNERYRARQLLKRLTKKMRHKVHRATLASLPINVLPRKQEYIIGFPPLKGLQEKLYSEYVRLHKQYGFSSDFGALDNLSIILTHPKCFAMKLRGTRAGRRGGDADNDIAERETLPKEMSQALLEIVDQEPDLDNVNLSWRSRHIMSILDECRKVKEKVLVFSQYLDVLDYFQDIFERQGRKYSRIDGSTDKRVALVDRFNRQDYEVFLIATKAGGTGLNIQGASRIIIVDFKYNPMWEQQAIGRAFRIKQTKDVYVYRFVGSGSSESVMFHRAVFKMQLTDAVVDEKTQIARSELRKGSKVVHLTEPISQPYDKYLGVDGVLDKLLTDTSSQKGIVYVDHTDTFAEPDEEIPVSDDIAKHVNDELRAIEEREKSGGHAVPLAPLGHGSAAEEGKATARSMIIDDYLSVNIRGDLPRRTRENLVLDLMGQDRFALAFLNQLHGLTNNMIAVSMDRVLREKYRELEVMDEHKYRDLFPVELRAHYWGQAVLPQDSSVANNAHNAHNADDPWNRKCHTKWYPTG
ncbi:DNA repair protein rhp54 [Ceratocystis platani]|uniref:DNA repair protein rhp54 n=1 Tax=Ceratocystis fimbriata f. sp. platani TaxID=88771 RepID=A0A0F8CSH7_CERFI|nr:DNA repair protein rhp54 [Ceratocystis platani]